MGGRAQSDLHSRRRPVARSWMPSCGLNRGPPKSGAVRGLYLSFFLFSASNVPGKLPTPKGVGGRSVFGVTQNFAGAPRVRREEEEEGRVVYATYPSPRQRNWRQVGGLYCESGDASLAGVPPMTESVWNSDLNSDSVGETGSGEDDRELDRTRTCPVAFQSTLDRRRRERESIERSWSRRRSRRGRARWCAV